MRTTIADPIAPESPTLRAWNTDALGAVFAVSEGKRIDTARRLV
jgi:hypothetical protein